MIITTKLACCLLLSSALGVYSISSNDPPEETIRSYSRKPLKKENSKFSNSSILIDCHPDKYATQSVCQARGCRWDHSSALPTGVPRCTFISDTGSPMFAEYDLVTASRLSGMRDGVIVSGRAHRRDTPSLFGDDYSDIAFEIREMTSTHVRILISPSSQRHVPNRVKHRSVQAYERRQHRKTKNKRRFRNGRSNVYVMVDRSPFGFAIFRNCSQSKSPCGKPLIDTRKIPGFTIAKQYVQVSTYLPSKNVFGFGENQHATFRRNLNWKNWGIFARDYAPKGDSMNLYGAHHFYMALEDNGLAHGVLLLNSHAMNVALQPDPNILTYRVTGGIVELHLFLGPTADDVVSQYTALIGRPAMPPFWGLGYQLCRYGYKNLSMLEAVWRRNMDAKIPYDVQYIDIDYMDKKQDFTYDQTRFKNLSGFVDTLHGHRQKLVLIVDPGINAAASPDYLPTKEGLEMNVFIKDGQNPSVPFIGKCWTGPSYWPDFSHPNASAYWTRQHERFHSSIAFDGVWNDMNEISNMVDGSLQPYQGKL